MAADVRYPIANYNTDTENRLLDQTHYRYGINGRSGASDQDGTGDTEGLRGNKLVDIPIGDNEKVVGSATDVKNNAVIFFVKNTIASIAITYTSATISSFTFPNTTIITIINPSKVLFENNTLLITQGVNSFTGLITNKSGNMYTLSFCTGSVGGFGAITAISILGKNYIKRYFASSGSTEFLTNPALMGSILNFSLNHKIYNARVIEAGFTQLLAWTDGNVPPRIMDINKMKEGGIYYSTASDEQFINLAKQPPLNAPILSYGYSVNNKVNIVATTYFQFRYRYIYDDYQISTLSPISIISRNKPTDNYIRVGVNSGHKTVKFIQICVRIGNGVSETAENNTEWYIFNTVEKEKDSWSDNTQNFVLFFGDELKKAISRIDTDKNFESIPQLADHMEFVTQNQIILGAVTEGYDNI